ncbi:hypothetical protein OUZ56_011524 [Daphnia magna]|uniref:Uncharacterized protein n=1 Tax=Daphnia magna TaxID=35525 RepID=A0ABQ9Z0K8_9CRUS|nr:hypothetical protein OUZ56_011524 [Daphnia magna]
MTVDDISIGLALLASGRLPPEMFPPAQLRTVLSEIRSSLASGWALTPALQRGDLWRAYQEANVVTASTENVEFEKTFELYEIFVLPVYDAEGGVGLRHSSLPQFLAVAGDQQTFIELTEEEVRSCKDNSGSVCPLARAIERKNAKKTCSMALFLQDTEKQKLECQQVFVKWKGPEALYLGQRQWALSIGRTQTLVITCPARAGSRKQYKRELATVEIVEIPKGCSGQTDDWILQASYQRESSTSWEESPPSQLKGINWTLPTGSIDKPQESTSTSLQAMIASTLGKNKAARTMADIVGKSIRQLKEEDETRIRLQSTPPSYPYELLMGTILTVMANLTLWFLFYREKQQHDRERIEVRKRLEVLETTGRVEGAGDGEQAAQWSTQLAKLEVRIIEHEQHCLETLRSLEQLTK